MATLLRYDRVPDYNLMLAMHAESTEAGIKLDEAVVKELILDTDAKYKTALADLTKLVGHPFNPASPKQVQEYLKNSCDYFYSKCFRYKKFTSAADVLALASDHVRMIVNDLRFLRDLDLDSYEKVASYIHPDKKLANNEEGFITTATYKVLDSYGFLDMCFVEGKSVTEAVTAAAIWLLHAVEVASLISDCRSLSKQTTSYTKFLTAMDFDDKIHPSFSQSDTFRVYYNEPPLSGIPRNFRHAVISDDDDYDLYELDYVSQEPKIIASWTRNTELMEKMSKGDKIYRIMFRDIFNSDPDENKELYNKVKVAAIKLGYGFSYNTLVSEVGAHVAKSVKEYTDNMIERRKSDVAERIRNKDYVARSFFGTERYLQEHDYYKAGRILTNNDIQITGADILAFGCETIKTQFDNSVVKLYYTTHDAYKLKIKKGHEHVLEELKEALTFIVVEEDGFQWLPLTLDVKKS